MLFQAHTNSLVIFLSLCLSGCLLQGQSLFQGDGDIQKIVYNERVYIRDLNKSDCFSPSDLPIIGANAPNSRLFADNTLLYRYYSTSKRDLVVQYGWPIKTESGPRWNWSTPVLLPESSTLLAVNDLTIYYVKQEIRNNTKYRVLESINFATNRTANLFEKQYLPYLSVQAAQLNGKIFFIWNDGSAYSLQGGDSQLTEIDQGFFDRLVPNRVAEISTDTGKEIQPVTFLGPPTISPTGNILFFFSVREKQFWNREQLDQMWAEASIESKDYQLKNGLWPPKNWTFEGSDYVFKAFEIDNINKKINLVLDERLTNVTTRSRYIGSLKVKDPFGVYAVNKAGEVLDLGNLICKLIPIISSNK